MLRHTSTYKIRYMHYVMSDPGRVDEVVLLFHLLILFIMIYNT